MPKLGFGTQPSTEARGTIPSATEPAFVTFDKCTFTEGVKTADKEALCELASKVAKRYAQSMQWGETCAAVNEESGNFQVRVDSHFVFLSKYGHQLCRIPLRYVKPPAPRAVGPDEQLWQLSRPDGGAIEGSSSQVAKMQCEKAHRRALREERKNIAKQARQEAKQVRIRAASPPDPEELKVFSLQGYYPAFLNEEFQQNLLAFFEPLFERGGPYSVHSSGQQPFQLKHKILQYGTLSNGMIPIYNFSLLTEDLKRTDVMPNNCVVNVYESGAGCMSNHQNQSSSTGSGGVDTKEDVFFIRLFTERPLAISRWRRGRQCCNISGQMFSNSGPVVNVFSFAEVQAHRIGEKTTKKKVKFLPQN